MQETYQPIVIRYLLDKKDLTATREEIKSELVKLSYKDPIVVESSGINTVIRTLENKSVIKNLDSNLISLNLDTVITKQEIEEIIRECNYKIMTYSIAKSTNNFYIVKKKSNDEIIKNQNFNQGDIFLIFKNDAKSKNPNDGLLTSFAQVFEADQKNVRFRILAQLRGLSVEKIKELSNVILKTRSNCGFKRIRDEFIPISKEETLLLVEVDKKYHNLFLCSIQADEGYRHFEDTMLSPKKTVDLNLKTKFDLNELSVWGALNTNSYKKHWDSIECGDLILFHRDGYKFSAIFLGKEINSQTAQKLWRTNKQGQTWDLLMLFDPKTLRKSDVRIEDLNNLLGYDSKAKPYHNNPFYKVAIEKTIRVMIDEN